MSTRSRLEQLWTGRARPIYALGLPIIFGQLSQGFTSLIDTAMVAALDDSTALAAVGIASYATFLACALVLGFSVGVQTLVARQLGQSRDSDIHTPLLAGIQLSVALGLLLSTLFYLAAPELMQLLNSDPQVQSIATDYFRWRCLGIAALGFNFACIGYWNGQQLSRRYIPVMLAVQACNIIASYGFIYGAGPLPALGAAGSGLGSTIGLLLGCLLYARLTLNNGLAPLLQRFGNNVYRQILNLGLPNSGQHLLSAIAMSLFYFLLGKLGVAELALGHVLTNIALFIILPAQAFGVAATTLVSQSLGAQRPGLAYRWGWLTLGAAMPLLALLSAALWLRPELIAEVFIPADALSTSTIELLQLTATLTLFHSVALILSQALLGAADNRRVMRYFSLQQWLFLLPATAICCLWLNSELSTIWTIQLADRMLLALYFCLLWWGRSWQRPQEISAATQASH